MRRERESFDKRVGSVYRYRTEKLYKPKEEPKGFLRRKGATPDEHEANTERIATMRNRMGG